MDAEKNNAEDIVTFKVRRAVAKQALGRASKLVSQWQEEEKLERDYFKRILFFVLYGFSANFYLNVYF